LPDYNGYHERQNIYDQYTFAKNCIVRIEDDGVGVPDDEKGKLFQEGYGRGTGFGLYLIKRICEAYGWTLQETGKQGKGVQFTMTVPKNRANGKKLYEIS
jgi:signal transduction histidine kinase